MPLLVPRKGLTPKEPSEGEKPKKTGGGLERLKIGVLITTLVLLTMSIGFGFPGVQAAHNNATFTCKGLPAGVTATATWDWTVNGVVVAGSFSLTCHDNTSSSGATGRTSQANGYDRKVSFATASGPTGTPCPTTDSVRPGHVFMDRERCDMPPGIAILVIQTPGKL